MFAGLGCLAGTFGLGVLAFDTNTPQLPGVELTAVKGLPPLGMLLPSVLAMIVLFIAIVGVPVAAAFLGHGR